MRGKKKKISQAMAFIVLSAPLCHFRVCGAFGGVSAGGIALYIASSRRIKANP